MIFKEATALGVWAAQMFAGRSPSSSSTSSRWGASLRPGSCRDPAAGHLKVRVEQMVGAVRTTSRPVLEELLHSCFHADAAHVWSLWSDVSNTWSEFYYLQEHASGFILVLFQCDLHEGSKTRRWIWDLSADCACDRACDRPVGSAAAAAACAHCFAASATTQQNSISNRRLSTRWRNKCIVRLFHLL